MVDKKNSMIRNYILLLAVSLLSLMGCSDDKHIESLVNPEPIPDEVVEEEVDLGVAYGADISWVTAQEKMGVRFYDLEGTQTDMFSLINVMGGNAVRLRVLVDPSQDLYSGLCDKDDVLAKALRAKEAGLRIMIDFHYSNSWTVPTNQITPEAWEGKNANQLAQAVEAHTRDVLLLLRNSGIKVEWVQVGHEVTNGMLWPEGKCDTYPQNFATIFKAGAKAAKIVYPKTKVVLHIENGWAYWTPDWTLGQLNKNGAKQAYDIIGLSYYPTEMLKHKDAADLKIKNWKDGNDAIVKNMEMWVRSLSKKVMIVEFGYESDKLAEAQQCLSDLISQTSKIKSFEGIMMWEPQSYNGWAGNQLGLFTKDGKPGVVFK